MNLIRMTDATVEPITLAQAKEHLRVDTTDDDDLITSLISAARQQVEAYTRRALLQQTWRLSFDAKQLNASETDDASMMALLGIPDLKGSIIELPRPPLMAIATDGVKYYSTANVEATFAASNYLVSVYSTPGRICLNDGCVWPTGLRAIDSLVITYTAGYGTTAGTVPYDLRNAVKRLVNTLYEQREDFVVGQTISRDVPSDAKSLMDPYRIVRL